jgi:hypothetical protein
LCGNLYFKLPCNLLQSLETHKYTLQNSNIIGQSSEKYISAGNRRKTHFLITSGNTFAFFTLEAAAHYLDSPPNYGTNFRAIGVDKHTVLSIAVCAHNNRVICVLLASFGKRSAHLFNIKL